MQTLLWSPLLFHYEFLPTDHYKIAESLIERAQFISKIAQIDVKYLATKRTLSKGCQNLGSYVQRINPELAINLNCQRFSLRPFNFPRDIFTAVNGQFFVSPYAKEIGTKLIKDEPTIISNLGEGGTAVIFENYIFSLSFENTIYFVDKCNTRPIYLNPGYNETDLKNILGDFAHIDLVFNVIRGTNTPLFLVRNDFYRVANNAIDRYANELDAQLILVESEKSKLSAGVNIAQLPTGHVLVNKRTPEISEKLSSNIPLEKIIEVPTLFFETTEYYGIRCRTNVLK